MFKLGIDLSFRVEEDYSLRRAILCDKVGFDSIWFGDHLLPWHHSHRQSFFAWAVVAATAERTKEASVGVDVTTPLGGRYHPAIVAQAFATLDRLYPSRILLGVGTGEAMNEKRFWGYWPPWQERMDRLTEGIALMRKLWTEENYFNFQGRYFGMENIFLYVKPTKPIPIYFSALGPKAVLHAAKYGDHIMTGGSPQHLRDVTFPAFEKSALNAGKDPAKMDKMIGVSGGFGDADLIAKEIKRVIAGSGVRGMLDEPDPRKIEAAAESVSEEAIKAGCYICSSGGELIEHIEPFRKAGANHVLITDFSPEPEKAIRAIGRTVIPYFREAQG